MENTYLKVNSRKFYRHLLKRSALLRISREVSDYKEYTPWGHCLVVDISSGGAKLVTEFEIPIALAGVFLNLAVKVEYDEFTLNGVLLRRIQEDEKSFSYGIRWADPHDTQVEALTQALLRLQARTSLMIKKAIESYKKHSFSTFDG